MKRITIIIGVVILLLGAYFDYDSTQLGVASGFIGVSTKQTVYEWNLIVPVKPSSYNDVRVSLAPEDTLSATIHSNPGGIDFLLMNQGNFSNFAGNNGSPYQVYAQSSLNITNYSFVFNQTQYGGNLFLLFVSHSQISSGNTDVLLHVLVTRVFVPAGLNYIPVIMAVVGVALIAYGILGGRKKVVSAQAQPTTAVVTSRSESIPKVSCRYCGAQMESSAIFCPSCKRSQK